MRALSKEQVLKIGSLIQNEYYNEHIKYLLSLFELSRKQEYRNNPDFLLSIQLHTAKYQSNLYIKLREGRKLAKDIRDTQDKKRIEEELPGIELNIAIHEQLIRISKTIIDGIAWRVMGYDRMLLETAARGPGTGAINIEAPDFQSEFTWAFTISKEMKGIVIVNDLSRFLRIGDLTEIHQKKNTILVHEIKKTGKKVNNIFTLDEKHKLSKQSKRLLEFQHVLLNKYVDAKGNKIPAVTIDVNVQSHIRKVGWLLDQAKKVGKASEQLEPYLKVTATSFHDLSKLNTQPDENLKSSGKMIFYHSNWDTFYWDEFGNFMRLLIPYSNYPFKNMHCMDLMSGRFLLISELDLDALKLAFRKKGWLIEEPNEAELDKLIAETESNKEKMFSGDKLYTTGIETARYFSLSRGPFSFPIDPLMGVRITYEYLTFDTINQIAEMAYKRAARIRKPEIYFPYFIGENRIWN